VPDSLSARLTIGGVVKQFYTYLWLREDGTPYYAGKGCGERAFTRRGHRAKVPPKERVIIYPAESEVDAFETEVALIWYYGRKNINTGCLINLTDGGEGISGATFKRKECSKRKQAETRRGMKHSLETKLKQSKSAMGNKNQRARNHSAQTIERFKLAWIRRRKENPKMLGLGAPKKKPVAPAETASLDSTPMPSWMQGEAPMTPPRKKKPRVDSGGQLVKGSMRAA
jgi:hypothetical protein